MATKDYSDEEVSVEGYNSNLSSVKSYTSPRKKYTVGSDVDKELVFDFPFILDDDTVSYIKKYGKIMFLVRGPPNTGKATLSEMLCEKYPEAAFCRADDYFKNSFNSPMRNKASLGASHQYCTKKATTACLSKANIVIVQNTHMRKWEMQPYLDLAATHNYVVIMAITLHRFDVTPETLVHHSPDGLDIGYFRKRLRQWEDIPPVLTGWFLSPKDTLFLHDLAMESMKELISDGKFCRVFDIYDPGEVVNYFKARKLLCCLAGYTADSFEMKEYYLKPVVQDSYGKCFTITVLGFHFSLSGIRAVVDVSNEMGPLLFDRESDPQSISFSDMFNVLHTNDNTSKHNETIPYEEEGSKVTQEFLSMETGEWKEDENINTFNCSFIHLAQKDEGVGDVGNLRKEFLNSLQSVANSDGEIDSSSYIDVEGNSICRLGDDEWLLKSPNKVSFKAIFTGLYI